MKPLSLNAIALTGASLLAAPAAIGATINPSDFSTTPGFLNTHTVEADGLTLTADNASQNIGVAPTDGVFSFVNPFNPSTFTLSATNDGDVLDNITAIFRNQAARGDTINFSIDAVNDAYDVTGSFRVGIGSPFTFNSNNFVPDGTAINSTIFGSLSGQSVALSNAAADVFAPTTMAPVNNPVIGAAGLGLAIYSLAAFTGNAPGPAGIARSAASALRRRKDAPAAMPA